MTQPQRTSSTCQTILGSWRTSTPRKTDSEKSSSLGKKSAAVSTMKPMFGAFLPRELLRVALAMDWRSFLARVRLFLALGRRVLLWELTQKSPLLLAKVGRGFDHETTVGSFNEQRVFESGTANGLEVFSSTCLTVLGSWRTGTHRKSPLLFASSRPRFQP